MKKFIAITGNIGAGKTSIATRLANELGFKLFEEPYADNPYLENYYEDKTTWAFQNEMFFLGKRLENHLEIINHPESIIQDRCIYEGAEVFVKNLFLNKHLDDQDWENYLTLYQSIKKHIQPPDIIVYVKSSTERCMRNISKRNRHLENKIEEQYIADLNNLYQTWTENWKLCPVVTAEADQYEFKYQPEHLQILIKQIQPYL
jgi:deoxyadenosine/deoxycytidine kinase